MKQRKVLMRAIPALVACLTSGYAMASGFALQNQNGSGNGNAFAGAAAVAEDAATIFFNPAGMTYLPEGNNVSLAGTILDRSIKFSDTGTNQLFAPLGTNGGNAGNTSLIPAGYWSYSISPKFRAGFGISPTFGNKTEYRNDFIGRFSGFFADMKFINYNPSLAYQVSDTISVGGGINYVDAKLKFRQTYPSAAQREAVLDGTGDGFGYNLGALFQITPATRVGIALRSDVRFKLEGTQTVVGASNQPIKSELVTPRTWSLALDHKMDRWELLADITRTDWSSVQSLIVSNKNSGAYVTQLDYKFKDTTRVGFGANYTLNDQWKLRAGVAYDQSPVQRAADRTMTLPDSDRTWLSFGGRMSLSKTSSLDIGYSHIFFKGTSTEKVAVAGQAQVIRGTFDTSADLFSVQYNFGF